MRGARVITLARALYDHAMWLRDPTGRIWAVVMRIGSAHENPSEIELHLMPDREPQPIITR